jgi:hypothetical protein
VSFARGQWVYVHPDEGAAPRELRGLAGPVVVVSADRVTVAFRRGEVDETAEVEAAMLQPDRRRRNRPPAQWSTDSFAQSA